MDGRLLAWVVESRASGIRHPVARLRYLRRAASFRPPARTVCWMAAGAAALGTVLVVAPGPSARQGREPVAIPSRAAATGERAAAAVWIVESGTSYEIYSNGLRIETNATTPGVRRRWTRVDAGSGEITHGEGPPAGIVFHSTESHIVPFEESRNARLKRAGQGALEYVRRNRSYHYLIDRFGRVHRVVPEGQAAHHSGASAWGDSRTVWTNLNHSFLGVALEAVTGGGRGDRDPATPAQLHALKTLTEMLRSRYSIPASNCVTHAQVSLNPERRLLGHHTDWASGFPYAGIGLPDNYELPLPGLVALGYSYDSAYLQAGAAAWTGLALSEKEVRRRAATGGFSVPEYRARLQEKFRAAIPGIVADKEDQP